MKVLLVALAAVVACAFALVPVGDHTLYLQTDWPTAYQSNPTVPGGVPFVKEDQLCFLVGINTGCSGCEHGTDNLCSWVALNLGVSTTYTCVSRELADTLVIRKLFDAEKVGASHCPVNPANADNLDKAIFSADPRDTGAIPIERAATIHHTWHDMDLAEVVTRPHVVDRTSLWAPAGAAHLLGFDVLIEAEVGNDKLHKIDCAALNDKAQLEAIYNSETLLNRLVIGNLVSPRDSFCLRQIYGAYLSTRCPAYGTAYSGVSLSLYLRIVTNCDPLTQPDAHLAPRIIATLLSPLNTAGYWIVPDGTPHAFTAIPIEPNGVFEDYTDMDEVAQDPNNEDIRHVFGVLGE